MGYRLGLTAASGWSLWSAAADSDLNLLTTVFRWMIDLACAIVAQADHAADGFLDIRNSMRTGFRV